MFASKSSSKEIDNKGIACFITYQENLFILFNLGELKIFSINYGNIEKKTKPKLKKIPTNIKYSSNLYKIFWKDNRAEYSLDRETLLLSKVYINKKLGMLPHYYDCKVFQNEEDLKLEIQPYLDKAFMKYNLKNFLLKRKKTKKIILDIEQRKRNKI